jgi:phenylalanyl-tRNA synthetase beta chain
MAGFVEVLSFPFVSVADLDRMGVPVGDERRRLNKIVNPLSETAPYLRTSLLPGLFAAVARNRSRGNDDLALFESGSVFFASDPLRAAPRPPVTQRPADRELAALDQALGRQPRHLAAVLCGLRRSGWFLEDEPVDWTHPIAFVETAAAAVGIALERRSAVRAPWHPGRCAEFFIDDLVVGYAGELHPDVCRAFDLPARTAAAEIDLDAAIAAAPSGGEVPLISSFPMAKEDVALVVAEDVPAAAVERALRSGAGPLLESLALFDVYTGPPVPPGHKSLAYALRFRAADRTLTDAETATARDAAVAAAAEQTGAVQRTL